MVTRVAISILYIFIFHFYSSFAAITNYGPYIVQVLSLEKCNNEPHDNNYPVALNISVRKISRTQDEIYGTINIPKDLFNLKSKLSGEYFSGNSWKSVMDTIDDSLCKSIYTQRVASIILGQGIDLNTCTIKKGTYTFEKLDISDVMHGVTGNEFFYNRFRVKMEWLSDKGAVVCIITECMSKKT